MTSRLNPYLAFQGNARAAIEFYQQVFGGELRVNTFGEFGSPDPELKDKVMHAMLDTPQGYTLMASDMPPGMPFTPGSSITVSLSGDSSDDLRAFWDKLADGGSITVPFEKQMWGDEFGQLTDKFGVPWMVNVAGGQ
ncbi:MULTISPECIES: VOC family protein [Actinoplanes]|uniref:3-demethylubiquinone-9 3-methyltransferase n=2 Tax=Actinoplanes TaxID=1865 RepID=A0A0X3VEH6_9ACTN|nr:MULTISPECIES: VOC family protein [Actinoplanes]KUL41726.1 3-demethylubiquinone-9 3-methyltransferase [Actinoplanes awajinensis subsp. mycoplanecinus]GIE68678.1 VOC family protein [Actinoplanes palleronii]